MIQPKMKCGHSPQRLEVRGEIEPPAEGENVMDWFMSGKHRYLKQVAVCLECEAIELARKHGMLEEE